MNLKDVTKQILAARKKLMTAQTPVDGFNLDCGILLGRHILSKTMDIKQMPDNVVKEHVDGRLYFGCRVKVDLNKPPDYMLVCRSDDVNPRA